VPQATSEQTSALRPTRKLRPLALAIALAATSPGWAQVIDNGDQETVDGSGMSGTQSNPWNLGGKLTIGESGTGELSIINGGAVSNTIGLIGFNSGSEGTVTVTGTGSVWENSDDLYVGRSGTGTLTIADGGAVSNTFGYIGRFLGSEGTVTVTGAGSVWENSSVLAVGSAGTGTLTIADGGAVSNTIGLIGNGYSGTVTV